MRHIPVGMKQDGVTFHYVTQNVTQFKVCKLFISGIFPLVFFYHSWPWVTEITESETTD